MTLIFPTKMPSGQGLPFDLKETKKPYHNETLMPAIDLRYLNVAKIFWWGVSDCLLGNRKAKGPLIYYVSKMSGWMG